MFLAPPPPILGNARLLCEEKNVRYQRQSKEQIKSSDWQVFAFLEL